MPGTPFAPRSGCPMCGIVSYASTSTAILSHSVMERPLTPAPLNNQSRFRPKDKAPNILYRDDNFTIYEEKEYAVSSRGHMIICFNLHVPSLYTLSASDVPLLLQLQEIATRLLSYFTDPSTPPSPLPSPGLNPQVLRPPSPVTPTVASTPPTTHLTSPPVATSAPVRIGFITPPFKDPKVPIGDHLHAHAYIGDMDRVKWYDIARKVVYNAGWWDVGDLIAEIREQSTNNRVKSGGAYTSSTQSGSSAPRPINLVPSAGAREGLPNGVEITAPTLNVKDLEAGNDDEVTTLLSPPTRKATTPTIRTSEDNLTTPTALSAPRPIAPEPSSALESQDLSELLSPTRERPMSALSI